MSRTGALLRSPSLPPATLMWVGGLAATSVFWLLMLRDQMDLLCAVMIFTVLLLSGLRNRSTAAVLSLAFLNVLGDTRRLVAASFGQPKLDVLLLVGPAMAMVLAAPGLLRVRLTDRLSKAMFFLLVIMVLEVFNPLQGGISVGVSGAIFYIAPVLWFWVGRQYASPLVVQRLLYRIVFPLSVAAALLGFCQTFIGFLPYEQAWIGIATKTYVALYVGHSVRAFGFSVSGAEYAALLGMGAAGTAAAYFGSRRYWALAFPVLTIGVILASSRGVVIRLLMSLAVVWVLRKGTSFGAKQLIYTGALLLGGLLGIGAIASRFAASEDTASEKNTAAQSLIAHQTGGFAHPLDSRYSTAGIHRDMIVFGLLQGFKTPTGHGLGSTTLAAARFGGDPNVSSSEMDVSDMFISLGCVGGFLYIFVIITAIRRAAQYVRTVHIGISLPLIAILISTIATWMIGGQYSTSSLVCFLIGALAYVDNPDAKGRLFVPALQGADHPEPSGM